MVRTRDSHSLNRGSIPLTAENFLFSTNRKFYKEKATLGLIVLFYWGLNKDIESRNFVIKFWNGGGCEIEPMIFCFIFHWVSSASYSYGSNCLFSPTTKQIPLTAENFLFSANRKFYKEKATLGSMFYFTGFERKYLKKISI